MAQRSNKRQPVYSADALALRYLAGLALIALGVMMFLAVEMRMAGNIFDTLRQVCYGLTGGLAVVLPALPVWAGVLVIWSSQRKAPVRPFVFTALAYLALCAFVVLLSQYGRDELLQYLVNTSDRSWSGVIRQGFAFSIEKKQSGGTLGILLAFPFWNLVGTVLGAVVVFLILLVCVLLIFNLTPGRIHDLATGKVVIRWGRKPKDVEEQEQRQISFQQEQQRQMMAQQAYILQQQQAAAQSGRMRAAWPQGNGGAAQGTGGWPQQNNTGTQPAWPGTGQNPSVMEWQQQLTEQQSVAGGEARRSEIFDPKAEKRAAEPRRVSSIFGRLRNQEDGLTDTPAATDGTGAWPDAGCARNTDARRRTVSGAPIGPAATRWNAAENDESVRQAYAAANRDRPKDPAGAAEPPWNQESAPPDAGAAPAWQQQVETKPAAAAQERKQEPAEEADDLARWRRPEEPKPAAGGRKPSGKGKPASDEEEDDLARWRRPADNREGGRAAASAQPVGAESVRESLRGKKDAKAAGAAQESPWMRQVLAAEEASQQEPASARPEAIPAVKVPVAQNMIQDPTWKPELKHVEPKEAKEEEEYWEPVPYYAPPITDLRKPDNSVLDTSAEDEARSRRLETTLANFKVQARVVHVTHGPAISRFELELAPGTKVGKISELEKDIAYGMQATSVRIEAPIPGKSLVGVEVPNPTRATVTLREVLESAPMQNAKSILTVALGRDIAGTPIICDLAKMPHMLIAGATGSGKSVCINTIINSLLFRAGPDEVKMILIDPKVVELQCYNGIPHLLLPVVNDPHKAAAALAWAVAEMMERYDKFAERGVRNLDGYNGILGPGEKPMPRIVIIIDELADLMMVCKKDVEEYICRLTQLARAAGIHLIVATQRPSVDVITGLIKANIPSRIAFKTASYVDSRTILDRNGSEQLLGLGDMLYLPTGSFAPTRIQGCFLADEEVNRIVEHVRQANPSTYDPDILDKLEQLSKGAEETPTMDMVGGMPESGSGDAELFAQAVEIAIADGQVSTSTLQRRLKIGYARAGRLTDEMEERGIVSAKDGSKPRKCLITREDWMAMQATESA